MATRVILNHRFKQLIHKRFHTHTAEFVQGTEIRLLHGCHPHRRGGAQHLFNATTGIDLLRVAVEDGLQHHFGMIGAAPAPC